ncbi:DegT/DnrJ/EryC1/StrS family aminotransferase [bacterium]|nr:MAG: DegT/DnrJ/EryC1/StrS family aminotransferase [bacterium]
MRLGELALESGVLLPARDRVHARTDHGVRHAIAVHSGTDALRIIMDAAGIGPGDEVITTAFTFVASTETIVQTGATPVFADIDPRTFMLDPAAIEAAITPRTKAILPVHLFGQMADMGAITAIAERHGLLVLEDAAQAVECRQGETLAGNFGLAAGFSFYVTKNLGAAGDGGMIVTNDDGVAERCRSMRVHGMGRERYYYDHLGYTARLDEIQAAVLRVKLRALPAWTARRGKVAEAYLAALAAVPGLELPAVAPGNSMTWHQFSILSDERDRLQLHLKERGIDSMVYYPVPIHFHAPYERFGRGQGSLPVTESVSRRILALPVHPHLSAEAIAYVAENVAAFAATGVGVIGISG